MNLPTATPTPTDTLYTELMVAFSYFNTHLFDDRLPPCLVTLQRTPGHYASFSSNRFVDKDLNRFASELSVHPGYFATQSPKMLLSNLVHEMVHLEVSVEGGDAGAKTPGYHSNDWKKRMERVGLTPSHTGKPGGQKTGFRMYHYIQEDGLFDRAASALLAQGWSLTWIDRVAEEMKPAIEDLPFETWQGSPENDSNENSGDPSSSRDDEASIERDNKQPQERSPTSTFTPHDGENQEPPAVQEPATDGVASDTKGMLSTSIAPKGFSRVRVERPVVKGGKRDKYVCDDCKVSVWGKPGIHVICGECEKRMQVEPKKKHS